MARRVALKMVLWILCAVAAGLVVRLAIEEGVRAESPVGDGNDEADGATRDGQASRNGSRGGRDRQARLCRFPGFAFADQSTLSRAEEARNFGVVRGADRSETASGGQCAAFCRSNGFPAFSVTHGLRSEQSVCQCLTADSLGRTLELQAEGGAQREAGFHVPSEAACPAVRDQEFIQFDPSFVTLNTP